MAAENENAKKSADVAEHQAAAAEKTTDKAAETGKRGARAAADTAGTAVEAAASEAGQAAEAMKAATDKATEQAVDGVNQVRSMQTRVTEQLSHQTSENLDVMMQCGSIFADGFQSIWREWLAYTQGAMQRNAEGINQMMSVRTMQDLLMLQTDILRREVESLVNSGMKISEVSAQIASETGQRVMARGEESARELRPSA